MNVVVLHDHVPVTARPDELDALVQADAIRGALMTLGHTSESLDFTMNLPAVSDALKRIKPDAVFNIVESVEGQGRLIYLAPALLDSLRIPYAGAHTEAMFLTSSKLLAKRFLYANNVATPPWLAMRGDPEADLMLPGRYIIKSVWEEASLGLDDNAIVEVSDVDELRHELHARADRLGGEAFAEQYIEGREFNLSIIADSGGPLVLPPAEIRFDQYPADKPRIVGYAAKWHADSFEYNNTPRSFDFPASDTPLLDKLNWIARLCWRLFGLRGYARVDFRVDAQGWPWVLEVNANPCLSPDAGFMAAAAQAKMSYENVVSRLLQDATSNV